MRVPLDFPVGLNSDDTALAASPSWVDSSGYRFRNGKAEAKGGFESVTSTLLEGVCRWVLPWTDNAATLNIAFGTHLKLQLYQGGMVYDITPASGFTPGAVDGAGSSGYGTGAYGVGTFGSPSVTDYFPLTWSGGAFGQTLIASPRNQTIFQWSNVTATPAVALTNAPAQVTYALVAPQRQVFALGCSQESGGVFNPLCIRHCDVGGPTGWSTTSSSASTSREYVLPGGGRIVAGRVMGQYLLVWTSDALWLGTFVGQVTQVWRFDKVGDKCGLAGPAAAVVQGSTAYWVSPDRQFHTYALQGFVTSVNCPIREDFANNIAASQGDKIICSTVAEYGEVRWDYPDARDGFENSRALSICTQGPDAGAWHKDIISRTAMVDAGPSSYPCGVTAGGNVYWHEKGHSADGAVLSGFIESADIYLDEEHTMLVRSAWPDVADQIGPLNLTISTRLFPQGDAVTYGPLALPPSQDQVDFKIKGRLFKMRLDYNASPAFGRLGLITFDAKRGGRK
jgi:hypothetical protein